MKAAILFLITLIFSANVFAQLPYFAITNFDQTNELQLTIDTSNQNIWQIGAPDKTIFTEAYSNPNVIVTDTVNAYPVNNISSFEILLPYGYVGAGSQLYFRYKINTTAGRDGGYVEFSHDHGATWYNVIYDSLYAQFGGELSVSGYYSANDTLFDGTPAFSGDSSNEWQEAFIEFGIFCVLRDFVDTINVRFVFKSDSTFDNLDGWEIDDISVAEYQCSDVEEIARSTFDFTVFPNPATDKISLLMNKPLISGKIFIYDGIGRRVMENQLNSGTKESSLDVHSLPPGIFQLVLQSDLGNYSRKFVKE